MKKPTLCKAEQECDDCKALVCKLVEDMYQDDYYYECAFGHTKNEYLYHNFMNQYNKQKTKEEEGKKL